MSCIRSKCRSTILKLVDALAKFCYKPDYQKWCDRLEKINEELHSLDNARKMFLKLSDAVDKNKELHKDSNGLYFNWLVHNYCVRLGMGIRRLTDRWSKSFNLRNLLKEIEKSPKTLCVDNFFNHRSKQMLRKSPTVWGPSENDIRKQAHRAFEDALGEGRTAITKEELEADLKKVRNTAKPITDYVNENFAHMGQFNLTKPIPIIDDAHNCLNVLIEIYSKYALMLGKSKFQTCPEEVFTSWDNPLRVPWVR